MRPTLVAVGIVGQSIVWWLIARGRLPFWPATSVAFAVLGVGSVLVVQPAWRADTSAASALVVGVASGLGLFAATRVVVGLAARHPVAERSIASVYARAQEVPFATAMLLTLVVAVPGEELFWRGAALPELQAATSSLVGAILAWTAGVTVNAAWGSLPLLAGAVVGGGLWTALGVWSGGILAPLASHLVWTASMLAWPPSTARDIVWR